MFIVAYIMWYVVKSISKNTLFYISVVKNINYISRDNINYFLYIMTVVCSLISLISFLYTHMLNLVDFPVGAEILLIKINELLNSADVNPLNNGSPNPPPNDGGLELLPAAGAGIHDNDSNTTSTSRSIPVTAHEPGTSTDPFIAKTPHAAIANIPRVATASDTAQAPSTVRFAFPNSANAVGTGFGAFDPSLHKPDNK